MRKKESKLFKYCSKVLPSAAFGCLAGDLLLICRQSCLKTLAATVVNDARVYFFVSFSILKKKSLFECARRPATPLSDESGEGEREAGHGVVD